MLSHGAGDFVCKSGELKADYYLCWTQAEVNLCKSHGKEAYLVGSIYNDKTKPVRRDPHKLIYIPQHSYKEYVEREILHCPLPSNIEIPELLHPPLSVKELDFLSDYFECDGHITSLVDDSDMSIYPGHNILFSHRDDYESHFSKCKTLYTIAKVVIVDICGTFDTVASAMGIKCINRSWLHAVGDEGMRKQERFIQDHWSEFIDMPFDNCYDRIMKSLKEIYEKNSH